MTNGHIVAYVIVGLLLLIAIWVVKVGLHLFREIKAIAKKYREIHGSFIKIVNIRRIALIEKGTGSARFGAASGLSKDETEELAQLQKFMDRYAPDKVTDFSMCLDEFES